MYVGFIGKESEHFVDNFSDNYSYINAINYNQCLSAEVPKCTLSPKITRFSDNMERNDKKKLL